MLEILRALVELTLDDAKEICAIASDLAEGEYGEGLTGFEVSEFIFNVVYTGGN